MVLAVSGIVQATITIDTVTVGNAGNTADTTGYGSVGDNYNIGKYEVTAGQYIAFLNAVAATDTYGLYNTTMSRTDYGSGITRSGSLGSFTYSVASAFVNRPVNYVSWGDAARFANWLHNGQPAGAQNASTTEDGAYYLNGVINSTALLAVSRESDWKWAVTSENEWYKAAYHDKTAGLAATYFVYPTSSNTAPGRDMNDVSGNNANYVWPGATPYPIDSGKYTTVAGEFQNSDSPYGTFDQGGNVWEWNEAVIGVTRGLRGQSWFNNPSGGLPATYRNYRCDPVYESFDIGFRVAEVPEPATICLLGFGALSLMRRKNREKVNEKTNNKRKTQMKTYRKSQNTVFLFGMCAITFVVALTLIFGGTQVKASVIGNWNNSARSWNNNEFHIVKASVTGAGHTVKPDTAITAANLAGDDIFVIGEAMITPNASELSDLSAWVNGGGVLLILTDSGESGGVPSSNAILSGIGSSMGFGGSFTDAPLAGGVFATEGPPFNIVGQTLLDSPGNGVIGGNVLAGTYIQYEAIGSGFVFAFGDRPDNDYFGPTSANINGQLFLNIAAIPEPATICLLGLGALSLIRRKK